MVRKSLIDSDDTFSSIGLNEKSNMPYPPNVNSRNKLLQNNGRNHNGDRKVDYVSNNSKAP